MASPNYTSANAARKRSHYAAANDYHGGVWYFGHLLVFLGIVDAFYFRQMLTPQLLAGDQAILIQIRTLILTGIAIGIPLFFLYAVTRRTARAASGLYHMGAWLFLGVTLYVLVQDYQQFGLPGPFTSRINNAITRVD
jgi:hypothetical protein